MSLLIAATIMIDGGVRAEPLVTSRATKVRSLPRKRARVVGRLRKGKRVRVIRRRGRWVKIRAGRRRGWVPRTAVRPRPPRKKLAVATPLREPTKPARPDSAKAKPKTKRVSGWKTKPAPLPGAAAVTRRPSVRKEAEAPRDSEASTPSRPASTAHRSPYQLYAELGARTWSSDFSSDGQGGLGGYLIDSQLAVAGVGVRAKQRWGRIGVLAEGQYQATMSWPGIHYQPSAGGDAGDIAHRGHELSGALELGARISDAKGGIELRARGGGFYGASIVDSLDNVARMGSESLSGLRAGAGLGIAQLTPSTTFDASVDVLVGGKRKQTQGLEDGTSSAVEATWIRARIIRPLSARMVFTISYLYQAARTEWTGMSMRIDGATWATRVDRSHGVTFGIGGGM
jgi:hypothetical protein